MTFEQLRIFVAVAQREHMTRAAEDLNLSQPAVSAAIQALESRHAVTLFHRVGRRIELTEAGSLFLEEARAVLARAEAAEFVISELGGLKRGTLSIRASQTISSYWLPPHLVRFHRAYPDIRLRIGIGNTAQVAKAVLDGTTELGFVEGAIDDPAFSFEPVARDRLVLVVGADHPWAARGRVEPSELFDTAWILREAGSGTRSEFEASLKQLGLKPQDMRVAFELPSNEAVRAAVECGAGATVISEMVIEASLRSGALQQIGAPVVERPFLAIRHRDRYRSRAVDALLALIRAQMALQSV